MVLQKESKQEKVVAAAAKEEVLVQEYEQDVFNEYQNFLYRRLLYGITIYTPSEVKKMPDKTKNRIISDYRKCQEVLNIWKQQMTNAYTNIIFKTLFPSTKLGKLFYVTHENSTDTEFKNTLPFKSYKLTKIEISKKLIDEGLLPKNFYELKPKY